MAELSLLWLGAPEVRLDQRLVTIETRKATALLVYLSVSRQAHSREALAALLWPDYDNTRALANLRRALWSLNNDIGAEWLQTERDSVHLNERQAVHTDVEEFSQAVRSARQALADSVPEVERPLSLAVERYRGDFLTGFNLPDSQPFTEWQFFQTESLRQDLAWALEQLQAQQSSTRQYDAAIATARRWVALDRLHEPAQAALIRLYGLAGQRSAAVRQFEEFRTLLASELGTTPQPETAELIRTVAKAEKLSPVERHPAPSNRIDLPGTGLPAQATPFVGRHKELAEIADILLAPDTNLLTLVGPGGVGKTRLAIQAALQSSAQFSDGILYIPLAPLDSPEAILPSVASLLRFDLREQRDPVKALGRVFSGRKVLLVFDNFEHLIEGADLLNEWIQIAPQVKILVTSRERLNLMSEMVYPLGGLELPGLNNGLRERSSAYQLFIQSARRVAPGFQPDESESHAVAQICRLVEGLPLALELAASWVHLLSPAEVLAEIESSLDILTSRARDIQPGHRSLRGVFERSWELLPEEVRWPFACLSVFRGGFDREAAQQVADADLAMLSGLVDRSLVRLTANRRFELHELLRQFAAEKLSQNPEAEQSAYQRHRNYYGSLLQDLEWVIKSPRQNEALNRLHKELDNARTAWEQAVAARDWDFMGRAMEAVGQFLMLIGWRSEGAARFRVAVDQFSAAYERLPERDDTKRIILGKLHLGLGQFLLLLYRLDQAAGVYRKAEELLGPDGPIEDRNTILMAKISLAAPAEIPALLVEFEQQIQELRQSGKLWPLSLALVFYGHETDGFEEMKNILEALDISRKIGNRAVIVEAISDLGTRMQMLGRYAEAVDYFREGMDLSREGSFRWGHALNLDYIGYAERLLGNYDEAERYHQESLKISLEIEDKLGEAGSLDNLGLVALDRGEPEKALEYFQAGYAIRAPLNRGYEDGISLENIGYTYIALGNLEQAVEHFREANRLAEEIGFRWGTIRVLSGLLQAYTRLGKQDEALAAGSRLVAQLRGGTIEHTAVGIPLALFAAAGWLASRGEILRAKGYLNEVLLRQSTPAGMRRQAEEALACLPHNGGEVSAVPAQDENEAWLDELERQFGSHPQ